MKALISTLKQSKLFANLPTEILEESILPQGHLQEYQKGQFLIMPMQRIEKIGIVIVGRIHILHLFENGARSLMNVVSPGGSIGADLVCTRTQLSPYHAMAASTVRIFYFPAALLLVPGALSEPTRAECLRQMLLLIAHENMKKEYRLAILSRNGLRERIMAYLSMQARRLQRNAFTIPFSREEMASFLCVNRSALSHELSRMQQEGLISFHKNDFTLHFRTSDD